VNLVRSNAAPLVALSMLAACAPQAPPGWSGYAEGEYVYVAPAIAGTLARLAVQRGQQVETGAMLFTLDATGERAAREEADARLQAARAQAADKSKGRRSDEIALTEAQLEQARAQARLTARELAREEQLKAQGFVAAARLDDARAADEQARARVTELVAALRVARLPARGDEQAAAVAQATAAEQVLVQSAWREKQAARHAPARGVIAETYFREGEWVQAGQPVVSLLPPAGRKARFFVPQAEIGALKIDQPVHLRCDGCGAPIAARISFIANQAEYTPPVIYSNVQRAKLVFMVEARPVERDAVRLHPGQPLDVIAVAGS